MIDEYARGENTAYFTYDASNRRIWAKRNGTVEKYIHDFFNTVADYDGSNTLLATYNTPLLDWNLTKKIGANTYFYLKDGLASIRNMVDGDETAQNTYDYKIPKANLPMPIKPYTMLVYGRIAFPQNSHLYHIFYQNGTKSGTRFSREERKIFY